MSLSLKPNIHDAIWSHTIYKSQHVHYKIAWSYVVCDVSYRIELFSISCDTTKSYETKLQHVMYVYMYCTCVFMSQSMFVSTEDALGELLKEINQHCHSVRFEAMTNIIAQHCQSEGILCYLSTHTHSPNFLTFTHSIFLFSTFHSLIFSVC